MPYIEIKRIWTDSDEMLQLEVTASNDEQVSHQDFYVYPDELTDFGEQLQAFPKSQTDVVSLEYGEDPKFYCYFLLRAIILDSVGHAAIEIKIDNRLEPPVKASSNFFMPSEVASINSFGKNLSGWVKDMNAEFRFEWKCA
jgi:hypothetical protein